MRIFCLSSACITSLLWAVVSSGQEPAQTPGGTDTRVLAEALFAAGRDLMKDGRIDEACEKFSESYRLDRAAGTLLNLAVCHKTQGRVASAWGEFRQAIAEARKDGRPDREALASEEVAKLEPDLPSLSIAVRPDARVPGLDIELDGTELNGAAWGMELPIDPGVHQIVARAPTFLHVGKTITIEKGQHLTVTIDPLIPAAGNATPAPFWNPRRAIGVVMAGAGLAMVGVGAYFGVSAIDEVGKSNDACPSLAGQRRCTKAGTDAMDSARTDAWIADLGIGVGAAAILSGGILFLSGHGKESGPAAGGAQAAHSVWDVQVSAGAHGGRAILQWRF
jgi:hypothetical protein